MLTAKTSTKPRELPQEELSQAVCFAIVDCGQHEVTDKASGVVSLKPKAMFLFELDQKRSDGLPHILSQTFTLSSHKKSNLRPFLESWQGRKFEESEARAGVNMEPFIGKGLYITPVHNQGYANIGSISKLRSDAVPMRPTVTKMPPWVHSYIAKAKVKPDGYVAPAEGQATPVGASGGGVPPQTEDDMPF